MKAYFKLMATALLVAVFLLGSGFRAQTIIHDDGSETQDVLKVSDTDEGQKALRKDADEFQKRNYTIMDYDNSNGEGFRAMKTITKDGANKSSVDHIVHKTHDGLLCSTYYIDYSFGSDSIKELRLGMPMEENGVDLEYIVSFPSGTEVESNSTTVDKQGSTYMWSLKESEPVKIHLQATVWHKLIIYLAIFLILAVICVILLIERRRRNVISWKQAAHLRRIEMMLLCIPIAVLLYMGYEYYVGTHITEQSLNRVSQQQQEELLENREEDKRIQSADAQKQRSSEMAAARIRTKTAEISSALRELNRNYQAGNISQAEARSQAAALADQAQEMLSGGQELSLADKDVLQQLVDRLVLEANSIGDRPTRVERRETSRVSEEQRRADAITREERREPDTVKEEQPGEEADKAVKESAAATDEEKSSVTNETKAEKKSK